MMMGCHMVSVQSHIHQQTDLREILYMEKRMDVENSSFLMEGRQFMHLLFVGISCIHFVVSGDIFFQ